MSDRDQVMQDKLFWLTLEYGLSGWFRDCGDKSLGGFWCDGFIPESVENTKDGVDVRGIAWIVDGRKAQHKCAFTASVPQRMLTHRRDNFMITELALNLEHASLVFVVAPSLSLPNSSLEHSREP